ncbi:hypothetical protein [Mucilaginibacter sp. UR6-11]|uniref:hypothetical protein n=1 Tax=Mucilaginibacter sp. UR6-11 TaxID=1435644 RepID=UPI001E29DB0C|nr:hypothetical protein [Mucilaginibacter sp. UR6-11]MCC8424054.1 hypothetical protein [Mucilaginibacter sp. UR6-11]
MKQLEVFNKIGGIIKELTDQYNYIANNPENINDLELELFVANAHFLTDHAEILSKLNQRNKADRQKEEQAEKVGTKADPMVEKAEAIVAPPERKVTAPEPAEVTEPRKPAVTVEKFFEPVVQQPKRDLKRGVELAGTEPETEEPAPPIDLSSDTPKDTYSFIMEDPEVIRHELVIDEADDTDEEIEDPVEVIAIEEPKPVKEEDKPTDKVVSDKEEVITINQKMSSQKIGTAANITEQAGAQPITNLKQAITLNDKLLYIKDLFNGYSLAYSEAIEILNRFNTFEEANRFLNKNYTLKNNWDSKPETANKFFTLLKRRYSN